MAVLQLGPIVSDIRGKVGDTVFSRGQGGAVAYQPTPYVDSNTADQQAARLAITDLSAAWSAVLTEQQRADWRAYANQHPMPNRWGTPTIKNGYCYFVRCNAYWYRELEAIQWADAPTIAPLHPPTHTLTADATADTATIALPPGGYDPPPAGLILWHYAGLPVSAGVGYFRNPFRFTEKNTHVPGWTTTPWVLAWPWSIDVGQRVFSKLIAQDLATGAVSTMHQASTVAT